MKALPAKTFVPIEKNSFGICIWCEQKRLFNKAHIIPKSLLTKNHPHNYLNNSVCHVCNSFFGKFEQWLSKNSLLRIYKDDKWRKSGKKSTIDSLPILLYEPELHEWLVIHSRTGALPLSQLILTNRGTLALFHSSMGHELDIIIQAVKNKIFLSDVKQDFPDNFSPRAIFNNDRVILLGNSENDIQRFLKQVDTNAIYNENKDDLNGYTVSFLGENQVGAEKQLQLFSKWSREIWTIYATKIGYEFLALVYGADFVLDDNFQRLRHWVLDHKLSEISDSVEFALRNPAFSFPFQNDEYELEVESNSVTTKPNKILDPGQDILVLINNFEKTVDLEVRIGWLPPVKIILNGDIFDEPTITSVSYQFEQSELTFSKVCPFEEKTHLLLLKDVNEGFFEKYSRFLVKFNRYTES